MKAALLIPAALVLAALMLPACQSAPDATPGDRERYKKSYERYMDSYEPKVGGPG